MFAPDATAGGSSAQPGPDLQEYQSDELGFLGLNKEVKLQLTTDKWPQDSPPPPTSSLLSISQNRGLLAAGGQQTVVITKTDKVRATIESDGAKGASDFRPFEPDITLSLPARISQVAFSSDGSCLLISAEQGGGLAVYSVDAILQGNTNTAFEISTNSTSLRQLSANPAPESAELFAIVTVTGELLVADMKMKDFRTGPKDKIYHTGVSAVAWSVKGKALLAGLADGSLVQYKPTGEHMSNVPRPPQLPDKHHVSRINWLGNDLAIIAYSPDSTDSSFPDPSLYFVMERSPAKKGPVTHRFSKYDADVGFVTGERLPNAHFMATITGWHNIEYLVILSQSASEDISMLTKSTVPLASDAPADAFNLLTPKNDTRRALLPVTEDGAETTFPVGMAIDLTSRKLVPRPVPGAEDLCEDSPAPLPALMVFNTQGVLSVWWLVYSDAILKGVKYPGLMSTGPYEKTTAAVGLKVIVNGQSRSMGEKTATSGLPTATGPPAGSALPPAPSFGQPSTFGQSANPASGNPSMPGTAQASTFGQPSLAAAKPVFGASSFGTKPTAGFTKFATGNGAAFGSTATPGKTASPFAQVSPGTSKSPFGNPSPLASTSPFGGQQTAAKSSPWATGPAGGQSASPSHSAETKPTQPSFGTPSNFGQTGAKPAFGQPSPFGQTTSKPVFGNPSSLASPQGVFGSQSKLGNTGSEKSTPPAVNPFAVDRSQSNKGLFGNGASFDTSSTLGQKTNPFARPANDPQKSGSSLGNSPFSMKSAFADMAQKSENSEASAKDTGKPLFGDGFGTTLSEASKAAPPSPSDHEEEMSDGDGESDDSDDSGNEAEAPSVPVSPEINQSTTPQETPAAQKMGAPPVGGGLMGNKTQNPGTPAAEIAASGGPTIRSPVDSALDSTPKPLPGQADRLKAGAKDQEVPAVPLPPDTQSKDPYTPTNSSGSSSSDATAENAESAPLPPDPVKFKPKQLDFDLPPLPSNPVKPSSKSPANGSAATLPPPPRPASKSSMVNPFMKPTGADQTSGASRGDQSPLDDEGSGIDVANEISSDNSPESSFVSKDSSFGVLSGKGTGSFKPPAPKGTSVFTSVPTSHVAFFPPPDPNDESDSLRSPSPVRPSKNTNTMRAPPPPSPDASRKSISQRSRTLGRSHPPSQRVVAPISSAVQEGLEKDRRAAAAKARAQQEAEEEELGDEDDDYIRAELEAPIEPVTVLTGFVAHTDYVGESTKEGIPGQIEIVYRDANSMVDTLGLNLRATKSWVAGHSQSGLSNKQVTLDSLDSAEIWTMADLKHAQDLLEELKEELVNGRVIEINETTKSCRDLSAEIARITKRKQEMTKTLVTLKQMNNDTADDFSSLSAAQSDARQDLRRAFADFRSSLSAAEEGVALLRAKMASHSSTKDTSSSQKVPTLEAIERTINKMTAMVEKKSADLDFVAAQLHKLGFVERPTSSRGLLQGRRSRSGSPFETPTHSRPGSSAKNISPLRASLNGKAAFTPRSSKLGSSLVLAENMSQMVLGSPGTGNELSEEELKIYTERLKLRKEANLVLKKTLGSGQARVRPLDD